MRKGKRGEREICALLQSKLNKEFRRIPMSGAFATNNNFNCFNGDILEAEVFNGTKKQEYVIECKNYNLLSLNEIFNTKSKLYEWIKQSDEESKGKPWVLIIKISRKGIYMVNKININNEDLIKLQTTDKIIFNNNYYLFKIQ